MFYEVSLYWQIALWLVIGLALLITLLGAIIVARDALESWREPDPKLTEIKTRLRSLK